MSWTQRTKSQGNNEASAAQANSRLAVLASPALHSYELMRVVLNGVLLAGVLNDAEVEQ